MAIALRRFLRPTDSINYRRLLPGMMGLLCCSVMLSYLFQETVFHRHCFTKLGIILTGNFIFWGLSAPLVVTFHKRYAGSRHVTLLSLGLGAILLFVNQFLIQQAILLIFLYGFGCLEGVTNAVYMLFENNIVTSGLIYCILTLLAYERASKNPDTAAVSFPVKTVESVVSKTAAYKQQFALKENGTRMQVSVDDIRYIEASRNTILLFTDKRKYVVYQSMVSVEKELDPACFIKIHRAFLVNRSFIQSCAGGSNGNMLVTLTCGTELIMTRHYKSRMSG